MLQDASDGRRNALEVVLEVSVCGFDSRSVQHCDRGMEDCADVVEARLEDIAARDELGKRRAEVPEDLWRAVCGKRRNRNLALDLKDVGLRRLQVAGYGAQRLGFRDDHVRFAPLLPQDVRHLERTAGPSRV